MIKVAATDEEPSYTINCLYSDRVVLESGGFLESSGRQATPTSNFIWILEWQIA